jgi:transcriptional regulator with XRE-family HTH domain
MDAGKTIFSMHGGARGKVTGGSDKTVNDKTIAWHGISHRTKLNIKQEWERQKRFHGRTQEDLAAYLNISQGAVSKLLNDQAGHPWSIDKIELFARFCDVPLADLIGDAELVDDVDGRRGTDALPTARQVNQARAALRRRPRRGQSSPARRPARAAHGEHRSFRSIVQPGNHEAFDCRGRLLGVAAVACGSVAPERFC